MEIQLAWLTQKLKDLPERTFEDRIKLKITILLNMSTNTMIEKKNVWFRVVELFIFNEQQYIHQPRTSELSFANLMITLI